MKVRLLFGLVLVLVVVVVSFLGFVFLSGPCKYGPGRLSDFSRDCTCSGLLVDTSFSFGALDAGQTWHCFGLMSNQKCYYLKPVGSTFAEIEYPCSEHMGPSDIQQQREAIQTNNAALCEQIQNTQIKQDCIDTINSKITG